MKTYKPHLICETRRKVEDLCRDLVVNNDHIHLVEMRLRDSISKEPVKISKSFGRGGEGSVINLMIIPCTKFQDLNFLKIFSDFSEHVFLN